MSHSSLCSAVTSYVVRFIGLRGNPRSVMFLTSDLSVLARPPASAPLCAREGGWLAYCAVLCYFLLVRRSSYDTSEYNSLIFYTAFEFSKRKFTAKYGQSLPVWALLASGSTGGVSGSHSRLAMPLISQPSFDRLRIGFPAIHSVCVSYWHISTTPKLLSPRCN